MKTNDKIIIIPDFLVVMLAIDDLPGQSISEIHYKVKITYSHLHNIKKILLEKGWITITKDGLKHLPSLTEQGKEILQNTNALLKSLNITKEQVYEYKQKDKKVIENVSNQEN